MHIEVCSHTILQGRKARKSRKSIAGWPGLSDDVTVTMTRDRLGERHRMTWRPSHRLYADYMVY